MGIGDAIRLLDADCWQEAFDELTRVWRDCRCPRLAEEIERLSGFAARHQAPIEARGRKLQAEWEQRLVERRAVDLGVLLGCLAEGSAKEHKARFRMLGELPPDPRLTRALAAYADEVRLSSTGARPAWTAFFKLVKHTGDPRLRQGLAGLEAWAISEIARAGDPDWVEFPTYLAAQIDRALDGLPEEGSCSELAQIRAAVDRTLARPFTEAGRGRADVDLDALEAAVLETPDDDGVLEVWADALSEAGDLRGELVLLQLAAERGQLKKKDLPRLNRMLRDNLIRWLGPLAPFVEPDLCRFARGLLEVAHLDPRRFAADALDLPGWRTVRQASGPVEALISPKLLSLTRLGTAWLSDPDGVRGPVGWAWQQGYRLRPDDALAVLRARPITHLELVRPPSEAQARALAEAAPGLDLVAVCTDSRQTLEATAAPLLSTARSVLVEDWYQFGPRESAWLGWLEVPELHVYAPHASFHRSWVRRGGRLELVLTDTRGCLVPDDPAFTTAEQREGYAQWAVSFLKGAPRPDRIVVRGKKGWPAADVELLGRVLDGFDVVLPRTSPRAASR